MYKLFFIFFFLSTSLLAQNDERTYKNPVISGDFPDPSVIRVGSDFYAAGTTSDFAPNFALYHSKDLINWQRIGAVFSEPPAWVKGDCWAPELFYKDGTYYVYYTARKRKDGISCIGVATTKNLSEGFTDYGPLIEWGKEAIDAYVFKDDDDKLYITWKAYGLDDRPIEILASALSSDGLSLVGEPFTLTDPAEGWIERGDEGQCIVKRNGYYYLFYSVGGCCDNKCDYRVHVARAKSLRGKWEQHEPNPILQGGDLWKCSGHGTLVQTADGRHFYLYHAYHARDFEFVGRQGLLDELLWDDETGWPYFKHGSTPSKEAPVPFKGSVQQNNIDITDDFTSDAYDTFWQWDMNLSQPSRSKGKGLTLKNEKDGLCFWGVNTQSADYTIETSVKNVNEHFKGLTVYGGPNDLLAWGISGNKIHLFQLTRGEKTELFSQSIETRAPVFLKIEAIGGQLYRFYWSGNNTEWNSITEKIDDVDGTVLPQWGKGLRVGFLLDGLDNVGVFSHVNLLNKK